MDCMYIYIYREREKGFSNTIFHYRRALLLLYIIYSNRTRIAKIRDVPPPIYNVNNILYNVLTLY